MLFSGGGTKGTPPKEQRKERKPDRAEKYEIQEAVFVRWANSVVDDDVTVQELRDLTDVRFLSKFSKLILGVPVAIAGKSETDAIDAIFHAMVPDDPDDKLFQISVNELLSGQQKPLLGMCWSLIQIYWAKFAPSPSNERKLSEALKEWCLEATASFPDVLINDFTSSFRDGMAINILIKSFDESLIDLHEISELRGEDRIENALSLARRHFRVPRLIQPKEFYSEHLDMKSVVCYLMMLYLGMCEKTAHQRQSNRPIGSRRRSSVSAHAVAAPATDQPQHSAHASVSSAGHSSLVQQSSLLAPQLTQSVPTIVHPQQQSSSAAQMCVSQANQTPTISVHTTPSSLLAPPAMSQCPKAVVPITRPTTVISSLAKQTHSQIELIALQQQTFQQQQPQLIDQPQEMPRETVQNVQPLLTAQIAPNGTAQTAPPIGIIELQQHQQNEALLPGPTSADQPIVSQISCDPRTQSAADVAPTPLVSPPLLCLPSYEASVVPPLPSLPSQLPVVSVPDQQRISLFEESKINKETNKYGDGIGIKLERASSWGSTT